jgi:hypothetical protein
LFVEIWGMAKCLPVLASNHNSNLCPPSSWDYIGVSLCTQPLESGCFLFCPNIYKDICPQNGIEETIFSRKREPIPRIDE